MEELPGDDVARALSPVEEEIPPLVVVALHQESAFCVATLAAGRSNFCAGGHSFRSNAIITTSWKASPLRANSRSNPSCTAAVES